MVGQVMKSSQRGIALVYIIGAMAALAAIVAGVTVMTPSSTITEVNENRFGQAYYAAYSGFQYLMYGENKVYNNIDTFVNAFNGKSFTLANGDVFNVSLSKGVSPAYTVNYIIGVSKNSNATNDENYIMAQNTQRTFYPYTTPTQTPTGPSKKVIFAAGSDVNVQGSSHITGDVYVKTLTIQQATISGSVVTQGDANLNYATNVTGSLCSKGNVLLDQSTVSGLINTDGNVTLNYLSTAGSDIFSGGNITTAGNVTVVGEANAQKKVDLGYANAFSKSIKAGSSITFSGNSSTIANNTYSGSTTTVSWGSRVLGVAIGKTVTVNSGGSVGSKIETTSYPPNIAPTAPTTSTCTENNPKTTTFTVGTVDVSSGWAEGKYKTSTPLAPGKYRQLTIANSEPLTLKAGSYYFSSINLAYNVTLNLDVSGGDILIFVSGKVTEGNLAAIKVSTNGSTWSDMTAIGNSNAAKVYLEAHDDISLDWGGEWFGTLFSTGNIALGGDNTIIGAVAMLGTNNSYRWDNDITYVPSNYAMANW